jgi:NAD(P)-dependent dehydrogenase (short-subunit alcohol dehydrogenase family)
MAIRYAISKLLNVFFTRALNAHIPLSTPLIVNTVNPGLCATTLRSSFTFPLNVLDWDLEKVLAISSEEGSRQLVYAAIGGREDEVKMRGAFISKNEIREVSDFVLSEEGVKVQDRIWVSCLMSLMA